MTNYELDYDKIKTVEDIVAIFKALKITWSNPSDETIQSFGHILKLVEQGETKIIVEN